MTAIRDIATYLDTLCPPQLAESWDNVGLLVGDPDAAVTGAMTCLTITSETVAEAIRDGAQLIVTHHPLPLRPLGRLTTATPEGRYLLSLIRAGVAIYSPHTAFDSAAEGINQRLAAGLGLTQIAPLVTGPDTPPGTGSGRQGSVAAGTTLLQLAERAKQFLRTGPVQVVGAPDRPLARVAIACGSGGDFLAIARDAGCEVLVTGETRFHTCLEAEATGVALLLTGHYASERFAVEALAAVLAARFGDVHIVASQCERDPLRWV
jgi:dinuclear metal center YbgI/SA1388 family protein